MIKYKEWALRKSNLSYNEIRVKIDEDVAGSINVFLYKGWDETKPLEDISTGPQAKEITKLVLAAPDLLRESRWALSVLENRKNDLNEDEKVVLKELMAAIKKATK